MKGFGSMTFLSAAAVVLMLGGCGGSSTRPALPVGLPATMLDPAAKPDPVIAERMDIKMKIMTARTAVSAVNNDSTDDEVSAADAAIMAAKMAIAAAGNVPAEERAATPERSPCSKPSFPAPGWPARKPWKQPIWPREWP